MNAQETIFHWESNALIHLECMCNVLPVHFEGRNKKRYKLVRSILGVNLIISTPSVSTMWAGDAAA